MDDKLDRFVDGIFGGGNLIYISGVLGMALIVIGLVLMARKKSDGAKSKKTVGIISLVVGVGIILSGIMQSLTL